MSHLAVTPDGSLNVIHSSTIVDGVKMTLRLSADNGRVFPVGLTLIDPDQPSNKAAERVALLLVGVHILFQGTVVFYDLDDDTLNALLEDAS